MPGRRNSRSRYGNGKRRRSGNRKGKSRTYYVVDRGGVRM